jgi:hypothetical protein
VTAFTNEKSGSGGLQNDKISPENGAILQMSDQSQKEAQVLPDVKNVESVRRLK